MEIIQIIGIGLASLFIILLIKQYKPEFAVYVSLVAGALILGLVIGKLTGVVEMIQVFSQKASLTTEFLAVMIKITGIAFLSEFAVSVCTDSGESAIASKIEIGSKIIIISMSIPIITSLLEIVLKILP